MIDWINCHVALLEASCIPYTRVPTIFNGNLLVVYKSTPPPQISLFHIFANSTPFFGDFAPLFFWFLFLVYPFKQKSGPVHPGATDGPGLLDLR